MPPVSLSISVLSPALSTPPATGNGQVPRFKAQQSSIRRAWASKIKQKIETLCVLVRGESNQSGVRRAAALRERIGCRADRIRSAIRNSRDTHSARNAIHNDLKKLENDEQKLKRLTHDVECLDTVLAERSTHRYLNTTPDQATKRREKLYRLDNSPLARNLRDEFPALRSIWDTVQREKTLEITKDGTSALYGLYVSGADEGGLPSMSFDNLKDLFSLSENLQKLSPGGRGAGELLYPALKVAYERNRNAPDGKNDHALVDMLRDLSSRNQDKGVLAQLGWRTKAGALDFHLQGKQAVPLSSKEQQALRNDLIAELDTLLSGIADAGRQIQRDELMAQTSTWARAVQSDLVQETELLYASAQAWRDQAGADPIMAMSPATATDVLIDKAIDQVLVKSAEDNHGPLLRNLKTYLSRAAMDIEQGLEARHVRDYMTPRQIAELRRDLLRGVVTATGIRSKIAHRLQTERAFHPRPANDTKPANARSEEMKPVPLDFQVEKLHREANRMAKVRQRNIKRLRENLKREASHVLLACLNVNNVAEIQPRKIATLIDARNALKLGDDDWRKLLGEVTASPYMSRNLQRLNAGALRKHMLGQLEPRAGMNGHAAIADSAANRMLQDLWFSTKASMIQQNVSPSLKGLCGALTLSRGADRDRKALFSRINELRGWVDAMAVDLKMNEALFAQCRSTILNAVLQPLTDEELGTLLSALATPRSESPITQQAAAGSQAAYQPKMKMGQLFAHDLAGNGQGLVEKTDLFLKELNDAGLAQLNARLGALENSLFPGFNKSFLAEAGKIYQVLDTPKASLTNGVSAAIELERLVQESVPQESAGQARNGPESLRPTEMRSVRFVRTAHGYTTSAHLAGKLRAEISILDKQLQAGQALLKTANFQSRSAAQAWRNGAVQRILKASGIHTALDRLGHRVPDLAPSWYPASASRQAEHAYARINDYNSDSQGYETPTNRNSAAVARARLDGLSNRRSNAASIASAVSPAENQDVRSWSSLTTVRPNSMYSDTSRPTLPTPVSSEYSEIDAHSAYYDTVAGATSGSDGEIVPKRPAPPPPVSMESKKENLYDTVYDSGYEAAGKDGALESASPPVQNVLTRSSMQAERSIAGAAENRQASSAMRASTGGDTASALRNNRTDLDPADRMVAEQRDMRALMQQELLARAAKRNAASRPEAEAAQQPQAAAVVRAERNSSPLPKDGIFSSLAARMQEVSKRLADDSDDDSGNGSSLDGDDEWR
jgi:hypothetical protein